MITAAAIVLVTLWALISVGLRIVPSHLEELKQMAREEGVYLNEEEWRRIEKRMLFTWPVRIPFDDITNHAFFRLSLIGEQEKREEERERAYLKSQA